jgi:polysaccharide pyruvyl transferase WcaK-like protein
MNIKIGLLWHTLRSPNLGVDALTRANISILEAAASRAGVSLEYLLLGLQPANAEPPDLPRVVQGPAPSLKAFVKANLDFPRALRACQFVVDISEGDSFADIYGPRRFLLQTLSKAAVVQAGLPLVLAPQTIGPFVHSWTKFLAKSVMRRSRAVFARDHLSSEVLKRMGVLGNVNEFIDVAFRLPFQQSTAIETGRKRIGINVSGLLYVGKAKFGMSLDYAMLTRKLIETLISRDDIELWLVPHVIAPGAADDDLLISQSLAAEYSSIRLAPRFGTASEAKSFISGLDMLVAARMHASIAAFSSGVPVIPIAYSRKFNGLYGTLGYEFLVDGRDATTNTAYTKIVSAIDKRKEMSNQIAKGMEIAERRLQKYEDYLFTLLKDFQK